MSARERDFFSGLERKWSSGLKNAFVNWQRQKSKEKIDS
jgi:hypothetical protein